MSGSMEQERTVLGDFRERLASGAMSSVDVAREAIAKANGNASHNTYLHFDADDVVRQAESLPERFPDATKRPALYGVPVSLKDCFDMAGTVTTFGSRFYANRNGVAARDSAMAARLREAGCLVTGKTHLHPLAYGITGQNAEYGDCVQPRDGVLLTGGSSSGACASVQEGSAVVGIGTDTGGSIRVPAALCGLVGFRASHAIASAGGAWPKVWAGAMHLAQSFDTPGFVLRDMRDAAVVGDALFGVGFESAPEQVRVGFVRGELIDACEPEVRAAYALFRRYVEAWAGTTVVDVDVAAWRESSEIFAGIQAHEAAALHRGHFDEFEASIAQRLRWGESLTVDEVSALRVRHERFKAELDVLLGQVDLLVCPCAPVSRMLAGADLSAVRAAVLRFTSPFSLGGVPVLSLPGEAWAGPLGTGVQVAAAAGRDAFLLAWGPSFARSLQRL
jgi:Asp-tRNA(Asn)/Glu-tRNA(Gln) amidotransferase A subunit family amidase